MRFFASSLLCRRIRDSLGKTQDQFGPMLGLTRGAVQYWEAGEKRPSRKTMRKMVEIAPSFESELQRAIQNFKHHPQRDDAPRDRITIGERMHMAIDEILEHGSDGMIEGVLNDLEAKADKVNTSRAHDDERTPRPPKKPLLVGPKGKSR